MASQTSSSSPLGIAGEFSRGDFVRFYSTSKVRTEVVSRAFSALVANAEPLGLTVRCGFAVCQGRLCRAPHWIRTADILVLEPETLEAAYGIGPPLAELIIQFRRHLNETSR